MRFTDWWATKVGEPLDSDEAKKRYSVARKAWDAAVGEVEAPKLSSDIQVVLERVAKEDPEAGKILARYLGTALDMASEADFALRSLQEQVVGTAPVRPIPEGARVMGGHCWRCPRCNFQNGMKKVEPSCRVCSYPGKEDKRPWKNETES